jgi:Fic family protein
MVLANLSGDIVMKPAFKSLFQITPSIARNLMRIEMVKERIKNASLTTTVLKSLRETARLFSTHYSTMIEGNQLSLEQIKQVLEHNGHFPGRERDEQEVKGYYIALDQVEAWVAAHKSITESMIQKLHALVMAGGKKKIIPTPYRTGQNVIRDGRSGAIVYLPPEAADVPHLMKELVDWIDQTNDIPSPLVAAVAHYQFVTIHPYFDGNGRTARLLTTYILHYGGYDLKGLYSLEEYYAQNLGDYYQALTIGPSHNYYLGRAEADITPWIEYFCKGMADACEKVLQQMAHAQQQGAPDQSRSLRSLDTKQRKILELFKDYETITTEQIAHLFGFKPRTARQLCKKLVEEGFLVPVTLAKKSRKYALSERYIDLVQ